MAALAAARAVASQVTPAQRDRAIAMAAASVNFAVLSLCVPQHAPIRNKMAGVCRHAEGVTPFFRTMLRVCRRMQLPEMHRSRSSRRHQQERSLIRQRRRARRPRRARRGRRPRTRRLIGLGLPQGAPLICPCIQLLTVGHP